MKRWRKYALCLACVCCMALLAGCGNDKNDTVDENATMTINQKQPKP